MAIAQRAEDGKRDRIKDLNVELSDGRVLTDGERQAKTAEIGRIEAVLEDLGYRQGKLGDILDAVAQVTRLYLNASPVSSAQARRD